MLLLGVEWHESKPTHSSGGSDGDLWNEGDRLVADGVEVQLGVVEEGAGLLVGGVTGAQLPELLLPPLHLLLVDTARTARGQRANRRSS